MKRALSLIAAAALLAVALALFFAGASRAGGRHSGLGSRQGQTDAEKVAHQREESDHWLDDRHDFGDRHKRHRQLRESAWGASTGTLEVDGGQNGGAMVTGWSRDSIRVIARVEAQARTVERARALAREVRIVNQGGRLRAEGPSSGMGESWCVTFDVLAPRATTLQLDAHNGPVCATDMDARMQLETVNGPVVLGGVSGDVRAHTQNGPLTVSLTGTRWRGAGLDASTQNGPVVLAVPRGYSCMLETGTINGPMKMDIPIVIQGNINVRHRHITTKLGDGGARVRAVTSNGPAIVTYDKRDADEDD